jgi:hypothetical protein
MGKEKKDHSQVGEVRSRSSPRADVDEQMRGLQRTELEDQPMVELPGMWNNPDKPTERHENN